MNKKLSESHIFFIQIIYITERDIFCIHLEVEHIYLYYSYYIYELFLKNFTEGGGGMAIKFKEQRIKTEVVVAREVVKDVVTGDIELRNHENGSQVNEILDVKARVQEVKTVIADGGVEINGVIRVDILYNAEDDNEEHDDKVMSTYHQKAELEFENFIDIPEVEAGMNVFLNIRVADISYEVLETDSVEVAITLIKYCAVSEIQEIKCISHITGLPEEEVVQEQLRIEEWVGDDSMRATIAQEVEVEEELVDVENSLMITGDVVKTEYKTMDNAVICEGVMEVRVAYRTEEGIQVVDQRIEFEQTLDLLNVEPGMTVYGNLKLTDIEVQKVSDEKIRIVSQVECYVKVTKPRRINVVTDVLNDRVDTEKALVIMEEMIGSNRVKDSIVHRINVPPTRPDIIRTVQCYSRVKDLTSMVQDGGVLVEGSLEGTACYTAKEDYCNGELTVCLKESFDFDNYLPVEESEEGMDVYVEVDVKRTSCQVLNDRTLEMNVQLEKSVKVSHTVEMECVTDLVEISPLVEDPCPPSFIVYVVQRGDTLWKIARRYCVNMEALVEFNNLEDPDYMEVGQKVLIPRSMINAVG